MSCTFRPIALATLLFAAAVVVAQSPSAPPLSTHQVNPDSSITFRYADRAAAKVALSIDAFPAPLPMTRDADGLWSVTTPVLPPEIYDYAFIADGVTRLDPANSDVRRSFVFFGSNVIVPAHPAAPWEATAIPHGRVDHHIYTTHIEKNLPENQDGYVVYTPPGYDAQRKGGYPVLYLLHGWSDDETGWTAVGRANFILDTLIAQHKAVPMIVVMPLGYGDLDFVLHSNQMPGDPAKIDANTALFSQALETEVMPAVESEYNIAKGRENHAIAGLSMGGLESLVLGLNHTSQFAWIVSMSAAIEHVSMAEELPSLDAKKADLRLLWVACGAGDDRLGPNRDFIGWARAKGLDVTAVETPGAHTWLVWRDNLLHFAPLLFKPK